MGASSHRAGHAAPREASSYLTRRDLIALSALGFAAGHPEAVFGADAQGRLTYGVHVSLAPSWLDPAETNGLVTPFMLIYALHDGVVKAMPEQLYAPSLAESWSATEDGLTYDFILRKGVLFHNGDPVNAEDVKFSFLRYHGTDHAALKQRVDAVETPDVNHVRFRLKNA